VKESFSFLELADDNEDDKISAKVDKLKEK